MKKFDGLAEDLIETLKIRPMDRVVDIGCATGGLIYSLKTKGVSRVRGMDMSLWAIQWGRQTYAFDTEQLQYYNLNLVGAEKEWAFAFDVFEHCPSGELERILTVLQENPPMKGLVVRIPVSAQEGEDFVLDVSKNDRTHIQIHDKRWWQNKFGEYDFVENGRILAKNIYDSHGVYCANFKPREEDYLENC